MEGMAIGAQCVPDAVLCIEGRRRETGTEDCSTSGVRVRDDGNEKGRSGNVAMTITRAELRKVKMRRVCLRWCTFLRNSSSNGPGQGLHRLPHRSVIAAVCSHALCSLGISDTLHTIRRYNASLKYASCMALRRTRR